MGTVTDVEYTGEYFWHQSPSMMNYVAALNGVAPRALDRAFTYCELGSARRDQCVLAALHPKGSSPPATSIRNTSAAPSRAR